MTCGQDVEKLAKGLRILLQITRAQPLSDKLLLKEDSTNKNDFFWPGDASPSTVSKSRCVAYFFLVELMLMSCHRSRMKI